MSGSQVLEGLSIGRSFLKLRFQFSVQVASLDKDKFTVATDEATPQDIPLKEIVLRDDFDSIRKELMLHFDDLPDDGPHTLTIDGLRTASGHNVPVETFTFEYNFDNTPADEAVEEDPVVIEDFSIKTVEVSQDPVTATNTEFYVEGSDPEDGAIFIDKDFMSGTVMVRFSNRPDITTINDKNIKAQRKEIGGSSFRWESVETITALDANEPILYVYFPSLDATPVYYASDHEYFEAGYKYRIILSKNIKHVKE